MFLKTPTGPPWSTESQKPPQQRKKTPKTLTKIFENTQKQPLYPQRWTFPPPPPKEMFGIFRDSWKNLK